MAVTVINLSDPVSTLVTKTNTISGDVGDVAQLTTGDDNVVDAINAVRAAIIDIDDSSEIVSISRGGLSVNNDSALGLSLTYSSSTGVIKLVGAADGDTVKGYFASDSANGIGFNFGAGAFGIVNNTVTSAKFNSAVSLIIYDSAGSAVKTIHSPGS
jgi:hypothetical protein